MIYYILYKNAKMVKIGYTADIWGRVAVLKSATPDEIMVLGLHDGESEDEREIHHDLRHIHSRGEFFHLCDELICFIEVMSDIHYLSEEGRIQRNHCDTAFARQSAAHFRTFRNFPTGHLPTLPDWIRHIIGIDWESFPGWEKDSRWYINLTEI